MKISRALLATARIIALSIFLLFATFPLLWIIITSLKDPKEIFTFPLVYIPSKFSTISYSKLFRYNNFAIFFRNSLIVTILGSFGSLLLSLFSGYSLSRYKSNLFKNRILLLLYYSQMIPSFLLMSPLYIMIAKLGGLDKLGVLSLVYIATMLAFSTIMAKSFFDRIPTSIEEAALVDGCSIFQSLFKITVPVMAPGLAAIFSFSFVNIWNELFIAVLFLSDPKKTTIPVALNSFISKAGISWDILSAGIVISLLPTMITFAFGQKFIIAGLTEGGVKG